MYHILCANTELFKRVFLCDGVRVCVCVCVGVCAWIKVRRYDDFHQLSYEKAMNEIAADLKRKIKLNLCHLTV